jgi:hypothetical protein
MANVVPVIPFRGNANEGNQHHLLDLLKFLKNEVLVEEDCRKKIDTFF